MTQNTEQNVRTRDGQVTELGQAVLEDKMSYPGWLNKFSSALEEAEARGAEEQRRKDAEGHEPVGWALRPEMKLRTAFSVWPSPMATRADWNVPLYTRPANVAALEKRIAELEEENTSLKNNPLENDVTCALMDSQYVAGAKFGWNCSQDDDHDSLTKMIEGRLRDRIEAGVFFSKRSQEARAALTREGEQA